MLQETVVQELDHSVELIQHDAGFIPFDVKPTLDGHEIIWMNVGDYRFTKTKFELDIRRFSANQAQVNTTTTALEALSNPHFLTDALYPAGFIFHISRCGSTLLAKALGRTPKNIVIDEGTPLNDGIWHYLTGGWRKPVATHEQAMTIYKNLLLALGRQRTPEQQTYFVKFRSWNSLFIDFITKVFPDVPCLFLYRDPVEVLVSGQWKPVWTLDFKGLQPGAYMSDHPLAVTAEMDDLTFLAKIYARYFVAALQKRSPHFYYLNYEHLTQRNLSTILTQGFHYQAPADQLALMETQFTYYSKDDEDVIRFTSDKEAKQQAATQAIRELVAQEMSDLYEQLERSPRNLARWL